jgi:hypothetical protein
MNSLHYFNQNTQQIYLIKSKEGIIGFLNKNLGKFLAAKLQNIFLGLRIILICLSIIACFY